MHRQSQVPVPVDAKVWRAIIGSNFQIPAVHSRVYYFPQSHIEHASSPLQNLNSQILSNPIIPCRVSSLEYLADPFSNEVYVKISLLPVPNNINGSDPLADSLAVPDDETALSYAKVLTLSDANCGGGFSVPKHCADVIYPHLNIGDDRPSQELTVTDVLGAEWKFSHIFRGSPRRHLLTSGWSKFVNAKKLIGGDSTIFIKDSTGKLFVGIRRAFKTPKLITIDPSMWEKNYKVDDEKEAGGRVLKAGEFARDGKGKVRAKDVCEAVELALQKKEFEVVYYPRLGWPDIVVKAEVVEKALSVEWTSGMRVKMERQAEDGIRTTCYQGTVTSAISPQHNSLWPHSPWRMLKVLWDEPKVMQTTTNGRLSPWEVEPIASAIPQTAVFPHTERFRDAQYFGVAIGRQGGPFFSTTGHFNQSLLNYNTIPAGMQGARQDLSSVNSLSNFQVGNPHMYSSDTFGNMVPQMRTLMSTKPNGDNNCQSNSLSLERQQSSLHGLGTEVSGTRGINSTRTTGKSIRLFGMDIQAEQPVESGGTRDEDN